jgi:hypothetical protein
MRFTILQTKAFCHIADKGGLPYCKQKRFTILQTKAFCHIADKDGLPYCKQKHFTILQTKAFYHNVQRILPYCRHTILQQIDLP